MTDDTGEPSPDAQWVPALVIESTATPKQRARNLALYQRLRDGQISPRHGGRENGLSGFVYDVPIERVSIYPTAASFAFRLQKDDECFRRLLSVISDHFDTRCDADDEVERLRTALEKVLDHVDYTAGACRIGEPVGGALPRLAIELARKALAR